MKNSGFTPHHFYYVYLLKSNSHNQIYVGSTTDLKRRLFEHNSGKELSTKRYMPWELIYYEAYPNESLARIREKRLKFNGNAMRELKKRIGLENKKSGAGFTLIEVLLSVATVAVLAGISIPIYQTFQVRNDLDIGTTTIAQTLRRAQILSQAVDGDISWGIYIVSGNIILFKGASYAARDTTFDEIFDVPTSITPSGVSEIVFAKFTGLPQTIGTITLISNINETRTITINTKGMVSY